TAAMLHLDGRSFSGSGTIVRFGVPLAALAGQDIHLTHIRARRDPPGLRPQHLKAVEAVTQLCHGTLEGGVVGSRELIFRPGELRILRPGYVPTGGGSLTLTVQPVRDMLRPLSLQERGGTLRYWGLALASHLQQRQVSQRMATACQEVLHRRGLHAEFRLLDDTTASQAGAALALFAEGANALLGADQAGAPRRRAEAIGRFVAQALLDDVASDATVDRHLADQLIIFAALAAGTSVFRLPQVTDHVPTNLWLVETILGARAHLESQQLCIQGIGYTSPR